MKRSNPHCPVRRRPLFIAPAVLLALSSSLVMQFIPVMKAQNGGGAAPTFEEIPPSATGITFVHDNAMSEQRYLPETLGPGAAFFDYDNDGWMDIYLVNYGPCDFFKPARPIRNALYRNNRDGTFTDVTEKAGVAAGTFGMGVAVGDYDNDGWADMVVTAYGKCILYRRQRDFQRRDRQSEPCCAGLDHERSLVRL
jgi:hypothetical protein